MNLTCCIYLVIVNICVVCVCGADDKSKERIHRQIRFSQKFAAGYGKRTPDDLSLQKLQSLNRNNYLGADAPYQNPYESHIYDLGAPNNVKSFLSQLLNRYRHADGHVGGHVGETERDAVEDLKQAVVDRLLETELEKARESREQEYDWRNDENQDLYR